MRPSERLAIYGLLGISLVAALGANAGFAFARKAAAAPAAIEPPSNTQPAKIATCDIYQLVERLVESDQYQPARTAEQERIKAKLAPLEQDLSKQEAENNKLRDDLQSADATDPAAQQKYQQYQQNVQLFQKNLAPYTALKKELGDAYSALVVGQFADAYTKVCAEARTVAEANGFTYVIAHKKGEVRAASPQQLVEEFLARPVSVAPDGVDITEKVRDAMHLPMTPVTPPGTGEMGLPGAMPGSGGEGGTGTAPGGAAPAGGQSTPAPKK